VRGTKRNTSNRKNDKSDARKTVRKGKRGPPQKVSGHKLITKNGRRKEIPLKHKTHPHKKKKKKKKLQGVRGGKGDDVKIRGYVRGEQKPNASRKTAAERIVKHGKVRSSRRVTR